jgi:hypothetical protein
MNLNSLRQDCSIKQKKGLHFIIASIIIWAIVAMIHSTNLPILNKNFYTFFATAPLVPLAYLISKIIKIDFKDSSNPLNQLGIIFSINQILYLLIAMWIFPNVPEKMVMVIAMIFGAHLFPYGWLYQSKAYYIMAIMIPLIALFFGTQYHPNILAFIMIGVEILFSVILYFEVRLLKK